MNNVLYKRLDDYSIPLANLDKFIAIFGIKNFNNMIESIGMQFIGLYHLKLLYKPNLNIYEYLESDEYENLFLSFYDIIVKSLLKKKNLILADIEELSCIIKIYVRNMVVHGSKYNACLVLEDE